MQPTLEITPGSGTYVTGERVKITVTRKYPGGTADDVTTRAIYTSSNRGIAHVANREFVAGTDTGTVTIRVNDRDSEATTTATFTVVPLRLVDVEITPSPAIVLRPGDQQKFTAAGRKADGSTDDVTNRVQWSSTNQGAAVVGSTAVDYGIVRAVADGDTTIVATDKTNPTAVIQARTIVFVRGGSAPLRAILLTPNPGVIPLGGMLQFGAIGVLSDGSSRAVAAKWSSSRTDIATVDANGNATGVLAGDTTITATVDDPSGPVRGSAAAKVQ